MIRLMALAALVISSAGAADPVDDSVRRQLGASGAPWYDAGKDSLRRMPLHTPRPPRDDASDPEASGPERADRPDQWRAEHPVSTSTSVGLGDPFTWLALIIALGILIPVLVMMVRTWRQGVPPEPARRPSDDAKPVPLSLSRLVDLGLDEHARQDLLAALEAALARGDLPTAAILCYAAELATLEDKRFLTLQPGITNRGFLADLQRSATGAARPLPQAFQGSIRIFEAVRFGGLVPSRGQIEEMLAHLAQVRSAAPAQGGAA